MLEEVLRYLKNWFEVERWEGTVTITDEGVDLPFLEPNQYYRIAGSIFNDGLHKYQDPTDELVSETFTGSVWGLAIPTPVIKIAAEIAAWRDKYENSEVASSLSPYDSESFAGYSYTRAKNGSGDSIGWQSVFRSRLNAWRKI